MIKVIFSALLFFSQACFANFLLIPMDNTQTNHLKAYGLSYILLKGDIEVDWLLNYRGGSFMVQYSKSIEKECKLRAISYEVLSDATSQQIVKQISDPNVNMDVVKLFKAAKIAVYSPVKISPSEFENTDAVLLVLKYAEIPFEVIYDEEILKGELPKYDWIHLHHEDFTGQFGRNMRRSSVADIKAQEAIASRYGYAKVSQMKLAVAKMIKEFCAGGGFLFAMCSGAETFDIALAADGVDIVDNFDGDGVDPNAQSKLDFDKTFAFQNFKLQLDEYRRNEFFGYQFRRRRFQGLGRKQQRVFFFIRFLRQMGCNSCHARTKPRKPDSRIFRTDYRFFQKYSQAGCIGDGNKFIIRQVHLW